MTTVWYFVIFLHASYSFMGFQVGPFISKEVCEAYAIKLNDARGVQRPAVETFPCFESRRS